MLTPFLTSSRRHFLHALGLLAVAPAALARQAAAFPSPAEPDWLHEWNTLPRQPVRESRDATLTRCLSAARHGSSLSLYYHGGSTPGRLRKFSPELVFHLPHRDTRYVSGYCHLRQSPRILRADRISLS